MLATLSFNSPSALRIGCTWTPRDEACSRNTH